MSRFIETGSDEHGRFTLETLADAEGCRWSVNDICCNGKCGMFGDLPYSDECNQEACECFEAETEYDLGILREGVKHYEGNY